MNLCHDEILKQLSQVESLISLPEVYPKIRQTIDDVSTDTNDLAKIVRMDPNLTSALLRIINSAFYGFPQPIQSISRAVQLLGIGQLHEISLSISAISSLNLPNDIISLKDFWRRSLFTGNLSRELAKAKNLPFSERIFVAGLLHDIGHMVLFAEFPDLSREIMHHYQQSDESIDVIEKNRIGLHYGDIGAAIMAQWGLPEFYQQVTQFHPTPKAAAAYQLETSVVHISWCLTGAECKESDKSPEDRIDPEIWDKVALATEDVNIATEAARLATADMEKILLTDKV